MVNEIEKMPYHAVFVRFHLPEYLSIFTVVSLNEFGSLFRRKYYQNGAQAGYIMHVTVGA
jgi:capsid portal protein